MRRPDVFTLDYSHPLAQGLVFAGLGQMPGSARYYDDSLVHAHGTAVSYPTGLWGFDYELGRHVLRWPTNNTASYFDFAGLLPSFTGAFWLSAWVLSTGTDWQNHGVFRADKGSVESSIFLIQHGGSPSKWRFSVQRVWSGVDIYSDTKVSANVWQHLLAMRDEDGALSLYIGGSAQADTGVRSGTIEAARATIGYNYISGTYAKCLISDVLVGQGRALSPAEIAILADRTDPILGGLIVEERPVLWFDMGGSTTDELTASNLTVSSPVLGTPAIGQTHALTASGITVEGPVLGAPTLAQIHALVAPELTVSAPVVGTPAVGQVHALTVTGLTVSAPVLGTPTLVESGTPVDALTASDLTVGSPVLGTPSLGQVHVLGTDGLVTGAPVLGQPALTQIHALSSLGLAVGAPVLGAPVLVDYEVTAISADEVARVVTASARMKTVTASARVRSVRYAVS